MKGTARDPIRAGLLQRHIVLDDPDDIGLAAEVIDECLGKTHYCIRSAAAVDIQKPHEALNNEKNVG